MPNRLAGETSPYLLQHKDNPVDWYPWGPEALERSKADDKPMLLSIKVDRDERPFLDSVYMEAVQAMTGHGGLPMTVFLTPDGVPFFGGTYFPPDDRQGLPSFRRVLLAVAETWRERPDQVSRSAEQMRQLYEGTKARAQSQGS